ncbi:hypothetical protein M977_04623 [Buttiauxella gaviniae ATCC 51604]|uniref:Uncharacterized protein n=2 Tax=Buttiauxella gaviniae TaxID=82990 RepID=A0A1B7HLA8_9ENTR|nr:hypothetical protein M977_04623 [Buttiauxella gaviniae ATCC 51604]
MEVGTDHQVMVALVLHLAVAIMVTITVFSHFYHKIPPTVVVLVQVVSGVAVAQWITVVLGEMVEGIINFNRRNSL